MQIVNVEISPIELQLKQPMQMAGYPPIENVTAIFVRIDTRDGRTAWGCAVAHPDLTGEKPEDALQACLNCADRTKDLHPTNIAYSLAELEPLVKDSPSAACAFDLAFHDLLGLAAGMPLYRILGGYRNRIQTSATVPLGNLDESVEIALQRSRSGFRILKVKGGLDPDSDVQKVKTIRRALPNHILRLDLDGAYDTKAAINVAHALKDDLEMLEQPVPPGDHVQLQQVTKNSPIPILADQSVTGAASALELVSGRIVSGLSVKMATCGGLRCAEQIDSIAQAAGIVTMIGCLIEPAMLISAGLHFALSSPNVRYCDLDGFLDLENDPSKAGFHLEEGWLITRDIPGLGCSLSQH